MAARLQAPLLVATLIASVLLIAPTAVAADPRGELRGGLSAFARGVRPPDATIESRLNGTTREIAVSVELAAAPDPGARSRLRAAGLTTRGAWQTSIEGYVDPSRLLGLARVSGVR